jgi:hypothetical protein
VAKFPEDLPDYFDPLLGWIYQGGLRKLQMKEPIEDGTASGKKPFWIWTIPSNWGKDSHQSYTNTLIGAGLEGKFIYYPNEETQLQAREDPRPYPLSCDQNHHRIGKISNFCNQ